ncbi:2OG-Fe(II) oxygenase family oxidoreductase [Xylariales sp. PMI_506]|nr:2OG-Fe(II) oxygenase family oxidoreductase [Xylariales sp. PMI_506]
MFVYIVGGISILLFFYTPIVQFFSTEPARLPRTPRPSINESLLAIDAANDTTLACPLDAYSVHILSKAPLVVYIENFISDDERNHLLEISEPLFAPSTITNNGAGVHYDTTIRDSSVAVVPRTDTVRCIEKRALAFQGHREDLWIELLRTQRYEVGGHYTHHFDWGSGARGWGRVSSMMAWVQGEQQGLRGGGTEFPLLKRRGLPGAWCRWVECPGEENGQAGGAGASTPESEGKAAGGQGQWQQQQQHEEEELGVTFRPIAGNAVFWENFRPDGTGRGWPDTWHAGLPVIEGVKVGLNIWSWGRLD